VQVSSALRNTETAVTETDIPDMSLNAKLLFHPLVFSGYDISSETS